ncbi:uncharacterized protein LOC123541030 [Mercenaria mercenaria]|uniref:uncharacterized protein LOC123541030 n=1 Tax=Mercenaria mercenaria TaxID=6596 RepID=UPI00234E6471|nr:uncharacterized protein LOC123541030 [Mercenaria mercenaria]
MKTNLVPESCSQDITRRFTNGGLFTLINQNRWTASHDWNKEGKKKCMTHQILDPFFSRCRTLYCPMFSLPLNGQCVPFMDYDLSYRLVVRLVLYERVNKSESVKKELMSQHLAIQRKLGFGQCDLCSVFMYLEKDFDETRLQEIYVSFYFKVTNRCNTERMWSKLIAIEKASSFISIALNKKMERLEVFWFNEIIWRSDRYEIILAIGSPAFCPTLQQEGELFCPKVKLTTMEYESVLEKHTNAKELLFAPNKEDMNGTIFVCCDDYILKQSARGVQMHVSSALSVMAIFFGTLFIHFSL